jgi:osmotically-inducible protein OsmY
MTKLLLLGLAASGLMLSAQNAPAPDNAKPDNTKVNKRDRANSEPTADQAKNNKSDREIMQEIRKSIVADKSLSTYGHNVKVVAQHGQVTLKGPVHSDDERKAIEAKAAEVAGADHVTNQIEVKEDKTSKK